MIRTQRTLGGAEVTVSDSRPGLGLGLSISRSIVEAHDGRVWASMESPRGATFHVQLPQPLGARGVAA